MLYTIDVSLCFICIISIVINIHIVNNCHHINVIITVNYCYYYYHYLSLVLLLLLLLLMYYYYDCNFYR